MQILDRNEMKSINAGNSGSCGPSCEGCIIDNSSSGYPCVKWVCHGDESGNWCVPEGSTCCVVVGEG